MVALVAQLVGFAHLAAVRHVRCAEHGELIELHGDDVATLARTTGDALGAAGEGHGHDHCLLGPVRRDGAALAVPEAARVARAEVDVARARPPVDVARLPIPLLRLAPKSSPPRA